MRPDAPIDTAAMTDRINANTAIQMDVIRQGRAIAANRRRQADRSRATAHRGENHDADGQPTPAIAIRTVSIDDVPANRRRGGDIRTILSPATVGATSGFLGTLQLEPGEVVTEHWHPYSEEFLFCVRGRDHAPARRRGPPAAGERGRAHPDRGAAPADQRRRRRRRSSSSSSARWRPAPQLGHVDTERAARSGGRSR